jgi:hypothetical protein
MPAVRPRTTLVLSDLMNISVNPTSENHHQSVTNATILEKNMKNATTIPMNAKENILVITMQTQKTGTLSWPVLISDSSQLQDAYLTIRLVASHHSRRY